ncbi:MAG: hypothetical protein CMJ64_26600 [Planctomycetaceae bacterium]|nr:hypothetical protein [Planctomycetaceae bacterium]
MMPSRTSSLLTLATLLFSAVQPSLAAAEDNELVFEANIQTVLATKCGKCHSAKARKGGLDLSTMEGLLRGGESGEAVVSESLDESLLWQMVDGSDMPPEGQPQLTGDENDLIRRWIESGARSKEGGVGVVTQHDVLPYLYTRCVVCHGRRKQEAELDLRSFASILKGGKSGPAIVPGKPEESLLLKRVLAKDMPPPKELIRAGIRPLESSEIDLITRWISQGAKTYDIEPDVQTTEADPLVSDKDRQFWSFQTPTKPSVPDQSGRPIDAFVLRKLAERDLSFSEVAPKLMLIRRVAIDLTGLPPNWQDVQRFVNDESDDWYAKLIDFYLDSPHYGERWGRYWLDLCGYADSEGKRSADPIRPHAWRYRDYVIRSLNDDKPYNRFLLEQMAGDELYDFENADAIMPEMMDSLVATGFLRMAPDGTGSDIVDTVDERFEVVADEIEVLGSAVLGLTLKCAQCHTHKYDPIPQRDYYRLVAVFRGAYDVYDWLKPTSVAGQSKQEQITRRYLKYVTADYREQWEADRRKVQDQIDEVKAKLAEREAELGAKADKAELKTLKMETDKQIKGLQAEIPPEPMIRALWDRGEPSPTWIFRRGEFTNPGDYVGPGVLSVLSDGRTPFETKPQRPGSTGRRLAFAEWLTDAKHPLTARVIVNRVWYHHFGRGIVESLGNFGNNGTPPTHPELLDWLAVSFVENGWSLKWLHREIMSSVAYRQSSRFRPASEERDPDNRWLSRMPLRRLEAEAVRDSLLAVAAQLDDSRFGEPDLVTVRDDGLVTSNKGENGWRRTVYVRQRRKEVPTILETFDLPQMIPNCVSRPNSTVATQSLHLLNNGMVRELSLAFAKRIEDEIPSDRNTQVDRVFEIALSRQPSDEERQEAVRTIGELTVHWKKIEQEQTEKTENEESAETKALANFCHVVMNSAEFLFVD